MATVQLAFFVLNVAEGDTADPLTIAGTPIVEAKAGEPYAGFTVEVSGGSPPYSFALVGTWPAGIAVNSATGEVSGTPTQSGTFEGLSVAVTDSASGNGGGNGGGDPIPSGMLRGVNLAGLEFTGNTIPGEHGQHYIEPDLAEVDTLLGMGFNVFRIPFLMERMVATTQPGAALKDSEWVRVDRAVNHIQAAGGVALLDAHNYGRFKINGTNEVIIGESSQYTKAHFADFWAKVATRYKDHPNVHFDLMNEPQTQSTTELVTTYNEAIAAIRATGAPQPIHCAGNGWSSAFQWQDNQNDTAFLNLTRDPGLVIHAHQYGTNSNHDAGDTSCSAGNANRLDFITDWARTNGFKLFLGEFNAPSDGACANVLRAFLTKMHANKDVWLGWTGWSAGPWWPSSYEFLLRQGKPQLQILQDSLAD